MFAKISLSTLKFRINGVGSQLNGGNYTREGDNMLRNSNKGTPHPVYLELESRKTNFCIHEFLKWLFGVN